MIGKGSRTVAAMNRFYNCLKVKYFNALMDWKEVVIKKSHHEEMVVKRLGLIKVGLTSHTMRMLFRAIFPDNRVKYAISCMVNNWNNIQKQAINELKSRVEKLLTIRKVNSAYFVFKNLMAYSNKVKAI